MFAAWTASFFQTPASSKCCSCGGGFLKPPLVWNRSRKNGERFVIPASVYFRRNTEPNIPRFPKKLTILDAVNDAFSGRNGRFSVSRQEDQN